MKLRKFIGLWVAAALTVGATGAHAVRLVDDANLVGLVILLTAQANAVSPTPRRRC